MATPTTNDGPANNPPPDAAGVTLSAFQASGQSKWYVVIITSTRHGVVQAWLPDAINLTAHSSWGPIVGNIDSALGNWLGGNFGDPNTTFASKRLTAQEWRGSEPLQLMMELHFFATEGAYQEVVEPIKRLVKMALPRAVNPNLFSLQAPGPVPAGSGIFVPKTILGIPIPGGGREIGGAGKPNEDLINVYIGNFLAIKEVFIAAIPTIEFKGKLSTDGLPMEGVMQIVFKTVYAPTTQDIDIYIPPNAQGGTSRPDISAPPPVNPPPDNPPFGG